MPNKGQTPLMNIIDRSVPRKGEGCGEWRCRYYNKDNKRYIYIAYQYGKKVTKEQAYDKCKLKRDKAYDNFKGYSFVKQPMEVEA